MSLTLFSLAPSLPCYPLLSQHTSWLCQSFRFCECDFSQHYDFTVFSNRQGLDAGQIFGVKKYQSVSYSGPTDKQLSVV